MEFLKTYEEIQRKFIEDNNITNKKYTDLVKGLSSTHPSQPLKFPGKIEEKLIDWEYFLVMKDSLSINALYFDYFPFTSIRKQDNVYFVNSKDGYCGIVDRGSGDLLFKGRGSISVYTNAFCDGVYHDNNHKQHLIKKNGKVCPFEGTMAQESLSDGKVFAVQGDSSSWILDVETYEPVINQPLISSPGETAKAYYFFTKDYHIVAICVLHRKPLTSVYHFVDFVGIYPVDNAKGSEILKGFFCKSEDGTWAFYDTDMKKVLGDFDNVQRYFTKYFVVEKDGKKTLYMSDFAAKGLIKLTHDVDDMVLVMYRGEIKCVDIVDGNLRVEGAVVPDVKRVYIRVKNKANYSSNKPETDFIIAETDNGFYVFDEQALSGKGKFYRLLDVTPIEDDEYFFVIENDRGVAANIFNPRIHKMITSMENSVVSYDVFHQKAVAVNPKGETIRATYI